MQAPRLLALSLLLSCAFVIAGGGSRAAAAEAPVPQSAMTLGQAAILGIVEGVTEYLPVSSTGHLLLAERALGIGKDAAADPASQKALKEASDAYTICIQAGAILAVVGLYFFRMRQMAAGLFGHDPVGRQLLINIGVAFFPAAVIGLLLNKHIKALLFGAWPVVFAWLAGGLAILAVSWWQRGRRNERSPGQTIEQLTWRMALLIGFAQCLAMWPGVSRSLVTIVGGVLVGLSLPAAVEFSFLLGVVTLTAATGYDLLKHGRLMLETFAPASLAVGVVFAFIAAVVSVKWMVGYLNRHGLEIFGYYRVALALLTGALILTGQL